MNIVDANTRASQKSQVLYRGSRGMGLFPWEIGHRQPLKGWHVPGKGARVTQTAPGQKQKHRRRQAKTKLDVSHRFHRSYVVRPAAVAPGVPAVILAVPADEVLAEQSPVATPHVNRLEAGVVYVVTGYCLREH